MDGRLYRGDYPGVCCLSAMEVRIYRVAGCLCAPVILPYGQGCSTPCRPQTWSVWCAFGTRLTMCLLLILAVAFVLICLVRYE